MSNESETIEYETKTQKENKNSNHRNGTYLSGIRTQLVTPIPACERIDRMFGSGGEAIIHYMWFEQGFQLFEKMMQNSTNKTKETLLKDLVDLQPKTGWGTTAVTIIRPIPPTVKIVIQDPAVKTLKGSQKHLIGSFWAGVLSRYFDKQLTCKDFAYDAEKDEFSCVITTSN
jgi:hypothetical protein